MTRLQSILLRYWQGRAYFCPEADFTKCVCGNEFNQEEIRKPRRDNCGNRVCDECCTEEELPSA